MSEDIKLEQQGSVLAVTPPVPSEEDKIEITLEEESHEFNPSNSVFSESSLKSEGEKEDYTKELKGMIGSDFEDVKEYLNTLLDNGAVKSFSVSPVGAVIHEKNQGPGFVQVVTAMQSGKKVAIDIIIF